MVRGEVGGSGGGVTRRRARGTLHKGSFRKANVKRPSVRHLSQGKAPGDPLHLRLNPYSACCPNLSLDPFL